MSDLAESRTAIIISRFVTPLLLIVLIGIANSLSDRLAAVTIKNEGQGKSLTDLQEKVTAMNAKLDYGLLQRIESLEERVRTLERKPNQ